MHDVNKLCYEWNYKKRKIRLCEREKESLNVQENPRFKHNQRHWCVIGPMLGCDRIKHINNCGFATLFNKVFPRLVTWEMKELKQVL